MWLFKAQIYCLWHLLSQDGISPLPKSLDAIKSMPSTQNVKDLRQFLGCISYYRNCINHYADITHTLTKLLKNDLLYLWTEPHQKVFVELNNYLPSPTIPHLSRSRKTVFPIHRCFQIFLGSSNVPIHIKSRHWNLLLSYLAHFWTYNTIMQHLSKKHLYVSEKIYHLFAMSWMHHTM